VILSFVWGEKKLAGRVVGEEKGSHEFKGGSLLKSTKRRKAIPSTSGSPTTASIHGSKKTWPGAWSPSTQYETTPVAIEHGNSSLPIAPKRVRENFSRQSKSPE